MRKVKYDFSQLFLFSELNSNKVESIIKRYQPVITEYEKGQRIVSPHQFERNIGFVLSGECEVRRHSSDSKSVVFNTIKPYESFGVMAVFTDEEVFPTEIFARKNAAVMFFSKNDIFSMIADYPEISMNVINFLANKILFLNKRLDTFSASTSEGKLAAFLLQEHEKGGTELSFNCHRCAETIGIGRASVYRAIDTLVESGIITYENKKIIINNPKGLEEFSK